MLLSAGELHGELISIFLQDFALAHIARTGGGHYCERPDSAVD